MPDPFVAPSSDRPFVAPSEDRAFIAPLKDDDSGWFDTADKDAAMAAKSDAKNQFNPLKDGAYSRDYPKTPIEPLPDNPLPSDILKTASSVGARAVDEFAGAVDNSVAPAAGTVMGALQRPKAFVKTLFLGNEQEQADAKKQYEEMYARQGLTVTRDGKPWISMDENALPPSGNGLGEGAQRILAQDWAAAHPGYQMPFPGLVNPLDRIGDAAHAFMHPETAITDEDAAARSEAGKMKFATRPGYFYTDSQPGVLGHEPGDLDWAEAAAHMGDFAKTQAITAPMDPVMYVHPGMSAEGEALQAARTAAVSDAMQGIGATQFADAGAAEAFARPTLESSVKAGTVGVGLKLPFVGADLGFIPVPKVLAPAMKPLQSVFEAMMKPIMGPNARSAEQIMQKSAEGASRAAVNDFMRTKFAPKMNELSELAGKRGISEYMASDMGAISEALDPDHVLRVTDETLQDVSGVGLPMQADVPTEVRAGWETLRKDRPDLVNNLDESFAQGPKVLQPALKAALIRTSALDASGQATVYAGARMLKTLADESREFMARNGVDIPELNGAVKLRPKQLFEAIDAIKAKDVNPDVVNRPATPPEPVPVEPAPSVPWSVKSRTVPIADDIPHAQRDVLLGQVAHRLGLDVSVVHPEELGNARYGATSNLATGAIQIGRQPYFAQELGHLGHEAIHSIITDLPETEQAAVIQRVTGILGKETESTRAGIETQWGEIPERGAYETGMQHLEEALADAGGKNFLSPEFIRGIAGTGNNGLIAKITGTIKTIIKQVQNAFQFVPKTAHESLQALAQELTDARAELRAGSMRGSSGAAVPSVVPLEKVALAAVRTPDGQVFTGIHHGEAVENAQAARPDVATRYLHEGFTTTSGRYVGREEAYDLAIAARQATQEHIHAYNPEMVAQIQERMRYARDNGLEYKGRTNPGLLSEHINGIDEEYQQWRETYDREHGILPSIPAADTVPEQPTFDLDALRAERAARRAAFHDDGPGAFAPVEQEGGEWVTPENPKYIGKPTSEIEDRRFEAEQQGPPKEWAPAQPEFEAADQPMSALRSSKVAITPRLEELNEAVLKGQTLDPKEMRDLVAELKTDRAMTPNERTALKSALQDQVPLALKQYNAAPSYVPGVVSAETRSGINAAKAISEAKTGTSGPKPQAAVRGLRASDVDIEHADLGDVKGSVGTGQRFYGAGTAATSGKSVLDANNQAGLWGRFLTKTGLRELPGLKAQLTDSADQFFSADPFANHARQMQGPNLKALTNAQMDRMVQNLYDVIPTKLVQDIRDAVYHGIDTGMTAPKAPMQFRNFDEQLESPFDYDRAAAAARKVYDKTPGAPVMRPATLDDLNAIWESHGRPDALTDNMSPGELKALSEGKDLKQSVTSAWVPYGRKMLTTGEEAAEPGYVHAKVANDLRDYKALGSDPNSIARYMRTNMPVYTYTVGALKKMSTVYGPQFPGYMAMKQAHDIARSVIGQLVDALSPGEIVNGQAGNFKYVQDGNAAAYPTYNAGRMGIFGGEKAVQLLEQNNIIAQHGEVGSAFDASPSIAQGAVDATKATGRTLENIIRGQDNANRSAGFFARLRAGDTPLEAQLRVNQALFDFTRKGPAVSFLSQSGIVPFAAWHAKVLPFMLKWMIKNPGEFMIVQNALNAVGQGRIPASQLPNMLRDKTNIVTSVKVAGDGHTHVKMISDTGVIPGDDVMALARSLNDNFGEQWIKSHLGMPLRAMLAANDQLERDARDPERATAGEKAMSVLKAGIGRPAMIASDLIDPSKSAGDKALSLFNPMMSEDVDLTKQGRISLGQAKGNLKYSQRAVAGAQAAVEQAARLTSVMTDHQRVQKFTDQFKKAP